MGKAELRFILSRDGIAGKLTAELTVEGPYGAVSGTGVSPFQGFPPMEIAADGTLYLKGTTTRPEINASDVVTGDYTLTIWRAQTELARVTFEPVALNGVIDVQNLLKQGRAQYATPEQIASVSQAAQVITDYETVQKPAIQQGLTDLAADRASVAQQQAANNAQAAAAGNKTPAASTAAIPATVGLYYITGQTEAGQVWERLAAPENGSTLKRRAELEAVSMTTLILSALANFRLGTGQRDGEIRTYKGNTYVWDAASTEADDDYAVLAPNAAVAGRWVVSTREYGENVSRHGVFPGRSRAATNAAWQAMLNKIKPGASIVVQPGATYNVNDWYLNTPGVKIIGNGTRFAYAGSRGALIYGNYTATGQGIIDRNSPETISRQLLFVRYEDVTPLAGFEMRGILHTSATSGTQGGSELTLYFVNDVVLDGGGVRDSWGTGVSFRNCVGIRRENYTIENCNTYGVFNYQSHRHRAKNNTYRHCGLSHSIKQRHKFFADVDYEETAFQIEDCYGSPTRAAGNAHNGFWISGGRAFNELVEYKTDQGAYVYTDAEKAELAITRDFPGHEISRGVRFLGGSMRVTKNAKPDIAITPVWHPGAFCQDWVLEDVFMDGGGAGPNAAANPVVTQSPLSIGSAGDILRAQQANTAAGYPVATFGGNHEVRRVRLENFYSSLGAGIRNLVVYGTSFKAESIVARNVQFDRALREADVSAIGAGRVKKVEWVENDIEITSSLNTQAEGVLHVHTQTDLYITRRNRLVIKPVNSPNAAQNVMTAVAIRSVRVEGGEGDTVEVLANAEATNHTITFGAYLSVVDGFYKEAKYTLVGSTSQTGLQSAGTGPNFDLGEIKVVSNGNATTRTGVQTIGAIRSVQRPTLTLAAGVTGTWNNTINDNSNRNMTTPVGRVMYGSAPPTTGTHSARDKVIYDGANLGMPEGWICTTAGTGAAAVWVPYGGQIGYRSTSAPPALNAQFVGEVLLDGVNKKWYRAVSTGSGAADWVALN